MSRKREAEYPHTSHSLESVSDLSHFGGLDHFGGALFGGPSTQEVRNCIDLTFSCSWENERLATQIDHSALFSICSKRACSCGSMQCLKMLHSRQQDTERVTRMFGLDLFPGPPNTPAKCSLQHMLQPMERSQPSKIPFIQSQGAFRRC